MPNDPARYEAAVTEGLLTVDAPEPVGNGDGSAAAPPLPLHPAEAPIVCRACGRENVAGTDQCARCKCVLKGNGLSRRTGLHVTNLTPEDQAFEDAARALVEQSLTDAG